MRRILLGVSVLLAAGGSGCIARLHSTSSGPATPAQMAELWEEPTDLVKRDLFNGPWPKESAPNPTATYTFVSAKTVGVSPGFTVADEQGMQWSVKLGREVKVEVVTSRILTALGYHQPPVYYLPRWTLKGGPGPSAQPEGRFRPKHAALKDAGEWSWQENPFIGTRPYNGLRVLMMLLNQSDLKNSNNTLYEVQGSNVAGSSAQRWYVARDIGTGLGETGRLNPKRDDPDLFEQISFMKGVDNGDVHFNYHGRHQELADHISPADVRWMCSLLAQLSNERWHDAFRAAGYDTQTANRYIARIKAKIVEGQALAD
jgi:hypothetical protein